MGNCKASETARHLSFQITQLDTTIQEQRILDRKTAEIQIAIITDTAKNTADNIASIESRLDQMEKTQGEIKDLLQQLLQQLPAVVSE